MNIGEIAIGYVTAMTAIHLNRYFHVKNNDHLLPPTRRSILEELRLSRGGKDENRCEL